MSHSEPERTIIIASMELLSSLLGAISSFLATILLTKNVYIAVAVAIGGFFVVKWIVKAWVNAMIRAQKKPFLAAFLFLIMAIALNAGLILISSGGIR